MQGMSVSKSQKKKRTIENDKHIWRITALMEAFVQIADREAHF